MSPTPHPPFPPPRTISGGPWIVPIQSCPIIPPQDNFGECPQPLTSLFPPPQDNFWGGPWIVPIPSRPFFPPQDNFGGSLGGVEAALRKHEAIESDIAAYGSRVRAVTAVAAELEAERYHDMGGIATRRDHVVSLWEALRAQVAARRERLRAHLELQRLLRDLEHLMGWMEEMEVGRGLGGWGSLRGTPRLPVTRPGVPRCGCSRGSSGST